jgi:hypothetical protein
MRSTRQQGTVSYKGRDDISKEAEHGIPNARRSDGAWLQFVNTIWVKLRVERS